MRTLSWSRSGQVLHRLSSTISACMHSLGVCNACLRQVVRLYAARTQQMYLHAMHCLQCIQRQWNYNIVQLLSRCFASHQASSITSVSEAVLASDGMQQDVNVFM